MGHAGYPSLCDFFAGHLSDEDMGALDGSEAMERLKSGVARECPGIEWHTVRNVVREHIGELLDIPFPEIMLRAWKKGIDLRKYADPVEYPPDRIEIVPMLEHTITSKHQPELRFEVNRVKLGAIPFTIIVKLELKGFSLEIQSGRIRKIHTGECSCSGSLQCLNVKLLDKESSGLSFPGTIDLGEGYPVTGNL